MRETALSSRIGLLVVLAVLPLVTACDPDGEIYEITENWITGWACDLDTTQPIQVDVYATNAPPVYMGGCFPEGSDTYCHVASGTADRGDDSVLQRRCGNRARAFEIPTPASINDGQSHKVIAFGHNVGPGQTLRLRGTAIDYPSTLYRQPPILYLDDHVLQLTHVPPLDPYLYHVYPATTAAREVGVNDHLYFTYYGYGNWENPVDTPWPDPSVALLTGFLPPPNPNNPNDFSPWQRGRYYVGGLNLLQGFGETFGAYLTRPDHLQTAAMVAIHNFKAPAPRPWLTGLGSRVRMEGYLRVPTDYFVPPGHNSLYFTLLLTEVPAAVNPQPARTIWFGVKLHETGTPPQPAPKWADGQGYAGATMPASPAWVTTCGEPTSSTAFLDERFFCFELSFVQWLQIVTAVNNAPGRPGSTSLTLDHTRWQISGMNVNAESWRVAYPGCPDGICTEIGDAHLGFSMRNFKLSVVH